MLMFALEKTGLLAMLKNVARPLITGLLSMPDKATEVFILVLSRRELGAVYFKGMVDAHELDYFQTVVGLTVMTLFIPCISNTVMMVKELGLRSAIYINSAIIAIAIAVGAFMNLLLRMAAAS
jgi:ferrous iron transport protein B